MNSSAILSKALAQSLTAHDLMFVELLDHPQCLTLAIGVEILTGPLPDSIQARLADMLSIYHTCQKQCEMFDTLMDGLPCCCVCILQPMSFIHNDHLHMSLIAICWQRAIVGLQILRCT